ncbi:hypothetical protein PU345_003708 [Enterobacter kobei]|nr:hypothetical protein [Enterobacter kobei]
MNSIWNPLFKRTRITVMIAGILMGGAVSQSAFALVSAPTETVKGRAPDMTQGKILWNDVNSNGITDAGDTLTIDPGTPFTFSDLDGDTEITPSFKWKIGDSEVGTSDTYTIQSGDAGKVSLHVTPKTDPDITDPATGTPVAASNNPTSEGGTGGGGEIEVPDVGIISVTIDGAVNGYPEVGTPLTANVSCVGGTCPAEGSGSGQLSYKWMIETRDASGTGTGTFQPITGATSSSYTPTKDDQRLKIQVDVVINP